MEGSARCVLLTSWPKVLPRRCLKRIGICLAIMWRMLFIGRVVVLWVIVLVTGVRFIRFINRFKRWFSYRWTIGGYSVETYFDSKDFEVELHFGHNHYNYEVGSLGCMRYNVVDVGNYDVKYQQGCWLFDLICQQVYLFVFEDLSVVAYQYYE